MLRSRNQNKSILIYSCQSECGWCGGGRAISEGEEKSHRGGREDRLQLDPEDLKKGCEW